MAGKIITGTMPKVVERGVTEQVVFEEVVDIPDIRAFVEKRNNIPECARFTTRKNWQWDTTELRWVWYEVEL
jgi:hypothetical protein